MNNSWMVEEVAGYLYGYLKEGTIQINSVLRSSQLAIEGVQDLLKLRLLKNERTLRFIQSLEKELASIKSSTQVNEQESYFEVRGAIDWQQTLQRRLQNNPKDHFHFVVQEAERTFQTDENVVLKEALRKLEQYCFKDAFLQRFENRGWYVEVLARRHFITQALHKNVYVGRIQDETVTDRMIEKAKLHRKYIYREAAYVLAFIRKIEKGLFTQEQLGEVLQEFFVLPQNQDVLFELYWIVQILKQQQNIVFGLLDGTGTKVASWNDGKEQVSLYHNSTGSGVVRFFIHQQELEGSNNSYLKQELASMQSFQKRAKALFDEHKSALYWSGRPDILIERVHNGELKAVVIGEVKNTANKNYAMQGLKELTQYMCLAKNAEGIYLQHTNIRVEGLLCLGKVPLKNTQLDDVQVMTLFKDRG